jgi:uncharacterized iron-regulated membrane protein
MASIAAVPTTRSDRTATGATPTRRLFGFLHRWVGLVIAGFLFVSGMTGAVVSWNHELDHLLNGHLMRASTPGTPLPSLEIVRRVERADPRIVVTYVPMAAEPGEALELGVSPRRNPATGKLFDPGYNQLFVDPVTGGEIGRRAWGVVWPITSENFVSFLYVLHYSLHLPAMWGIDRWGIWLMGGIAMAWTLDCFVGFYLTLPPRRPRIGGQAAARRGLWQRWKPAWQIKTGASRFRMLFDIHRALGLWLWGLLFMVAFTGFSLNLYSEIFYPLISRISHTTPTPYDTRAMAPLDRPITPRIDYAQVLASARADGARRGWAAPVGGLFYSPGQGFYGAMFHAPGDDEGVAGGGVPILYYDGNNGRYLGNRLPWTGTAADLFVQAQFPVHSGRILGVPGRIMMSLLGLVVATLSVTGVIVWLRKRRGKVSRAARRG